MEAVRKLPPCQIKSLHAFLSGKILRKLITFDVLYHRRRVPPPPRGGGGGDTARIQIKRVQVSYLMCDPWVEETLHSSGLFSYLIPKGCDLWRCVCVCGGGGGFY